MVNRDYVSVRLPLAGRDPEWILGCDVTVNQGSGCGGRRRAALGQATADPGNAVISLVTAIWLELRADDRLS